VEPFVILEVFMELQEGNKEEILAKIKEYTKARVEKQPLEYPSAGSTFKRPEGYFAGKLIMDAGLRGYRIGDAQVSEKHCGFVINRGNATATEIKTLMENVAKKVKEEFGVDLEAEVILLGK
jgi:UDP-N-acetylmuramate dehydrogenase